MRTHAKLISALEMAILMVCFSAMFRRFFFIHLNLMLLFAGEDNDLTNNNHEGDIGLSGGILFPIAFCCKQILRY
jgi:hypothetical protein